MRTGAMNRQREASVYKGMKTKTNRMGWCTSCVALFCLLTVSALGTGRELILAPNATTKVDAPGGVRRVYISNPSILDAEPDPDGLGVLVAGLAAGQAELRIAQITGMDLVYRVTVQPELQDKAEEVRRLLRDVDGINVSVVGENIMVDGELYTRGSAQRVAEVAAAFDGVVMNMTKLDLTAYNRSVARAIEREIGIATVDVRVEGDTIVITGTVPTQADIERVNEIARKRGEKTSIMLMAR